MNMTPISDLSMHERFSRPPRTAENSEPCSRPKRADEGRRLGLALCSVCLNFSHAQRRDFMCTDRAAAWLRAACSNRCATKDAPRSAHSALVSFNLQTQAQARSTLVQSFMWGLGPAPASSLAASRSQLLACSPISSSAAAELGTGATVLGRQYCIRAAVY